MTPTRTITHRPLITALLITALLITACAGPGEISQEDRMNAETELAARPTSEQIVGRYEDMQQRIRDTLDAELGPFDWFQIRDRAESTCGFDFPADLGGRTIALAPWGFEANIADDQWPRAQEIITEITAEYGFATAGVQIDTPGRHTLNGTDTTLGAQYTFGTNINTSMQVTTGCHLPAQTAGR